MFHVVRLEGLTSVLPLGIHHVFVKINGTLFFAIYILLRRVLFLRR